MEGVPITAKTVVDYCKTYRLKTAAELNNYIFNCEVTLFPLECKNYKENTQSLDFYRTIVILLEIQLNSKLRREMFNLRNKIRKSRIEDKLMRSMGFVFGNVVEEFHEGHQYERLYDMYINEKDQYRKKMIGDMILITQKKWDSTRGYFPKKETIESYLKTAQRLIDE